MIKFNFISKFIFIFASVILIQNDFSYSQDKGIFFEKEIITEDYKIKVTNRSDKFFSGTLAVSNNSGDTVFYSDQLFSRYVSDTLLDLNNDGIKELILDLGTGVNAYDFNMLVIFDLSKSSQPLFEIHNAEVKAGIDSIPKIVSHIRFSPLYLGTGYDYSLIYNGERLILETDPDFSKVLQSLDIIDENILNNMHGFKEELDECDKNNNFISFFEQYLLQKVLLKNVSKGWEFFEKNYNCPDKKKVRIELEEYLGIMIENLSKMEYKFNGDE